ncbi:acetylglutamate kinase [Hypericibacter terrae]|jgi:acetylglutamate kinase|uniref:Acetylglutamate kinase n=1 Tax=Hypericibacter terrae TaxID=2602015 RepID=A0A5J6ME13_9PROT|nr:acetylglutamate kinase [Hypericibacter terrae]QEX15237.1 acetylglutamate kinase [Hypericibacter terrae]
MSQSNFSETKYWLRTARTISEALPYMQRYAGKRFVIKYGGHAMVDAELAKVFAQDIVLMKQIGIHPIVVHGGGPQIGQMLDRLQIKSSFVDGLRVTDAATVEVVEMVLAGTINKQIVAAINSAGGSAIGLSGKDAGLIEARRHFLEKDGKQIDIGLVGEPAKVNPQVIDLLQNSDFVPVIAPVGFGPDGLTYNINADTAAGAIAAAAKAKRLLMLTDVAGVLDKTGKLIEDLTVSQVRQLMADGTISGGMIPKLETCVDAVEKGVEASVILDGRVPHALLLEIFTPHGLGTLVHQG